MENLRYKVNVKLYGGITCENPKSFFYGKTKFELEVPAGLTLNDLHDQLSLRKTNYVNMVNGKAQTGDYIIQGNCTISIFLPMGDRRYDYLGKIKS